MPRAPLGSLPLGRGSVSARRARCCFEQKSPFFSDEDGRLVFLQALCLVARGLFKVKLTEVFSRGVTPQRMRCCCCSGVEDSHELFHMDFSSGREVTTQPRR